MTLWMTSALLMTAAYFVGAVPFGFLVGKARGVDIRTVGSRNIGATNVGRVLGTKWGILVFVLDVTKGLGPTVLGGAILFAPNRAGESAAAQYTAWLLIGLCAVVGHTFPVYLRFRGGKGVATSLGIVLGVYPYFTIAGLLAFGIWVLCVLTTRYVSVGSICGAISMPLMYIGLACLWDWRPFDRQLPLTLFAFLVAGLIVYRHRDNIRRLREGTENKVGKSR